MRISPSTLSISINSSLSADKITPYKFTSAQDIDHSYQIPKSSRYSITRLEPSNPDLIYYFTKPSNDNYPIAILCEGSSNSDNLNSVIHFHRYFLEEFLNLGSAVLTLEQWGIDGQDIRKEDFIDHYTRSQRLSDHQVLIEHLKNAPPAGWNGQLILMGVSEGGPLVTSLTEEYSEITAASMGFSGTGEFPWIEELWIFIERLTVQNPTCPHSTQLSSCSACMPLMGSREQYNTHMAMILKNPTANESFMGMSYKYHADAMTYKPCEPTKIKSPYLAVVGDQDPAIESFDSFTHKMEESGAPITYFRIQGMDHYVRKRPDVIDQAFNWLSKQLENQGSAFKI